MPTKKPTVKKARKKDDNKFLYVLVGILIGFLVLAGVRFISYKPPQHTHYHANWSVWVNGQQQKFTDPSFYEEVASCSVYENEQADPSHRAHMHGDKHNIVHVHADGVTWNQFLENINSSAQPGFLRIRSNSYQNSDTSKVTYILNGKQLDALNGLVIGDEDKLLINYGGESAESIMERFNMIQNEANTANHTQDPASCSGKEEVTIWDRLRAVLI